MNFLHHLFQSALLLLSLLMLAPLFGEQPDLRRDELAARELARNFAEVTSTAPLSASYFINALRGERMVQMILTLPPEAVYVESVKKYARFAAKIQQSRAWKESIRKMDVPFLTKPPVIDGKIGPVEWDSAYKIQGAVPLDACESSRKNSAVWWIGWHGSELYIAADFNDSDIHAYSNRHKDGPPYLYQGDSLELFIKPNTEVNFYYELLFNPDGNTWFLSHAPNRMGYRVVIEEEKNMPVRCGAARTERGYSIEAAVPLRELYGKWYNRPVKVGDEFTMMMVRTDLSKGNYSCSAIFPLLYDGHNIWGYTHAALSEATVIRSSRKTGSGR